MKKKYVTFAMFVWLVLIGAYVRVSGLHAYYFSPDDVMHLYLSDWNTFHELLESVVPTGRPPLMNLLLHFLMRMSRNELALRCISLIPGIGLIFVFFFLGRKASGTASGITMSFIAAFAYGPILVSQVVREYGLLLFFLSMAYLLFLLYSDEKKYFAGYITFLCLAVLTSYAAVIPIAGLGLVHVVSLLHPKKPIKRAIKLLCAYLLPALFFGLFYLLHVRQFIESAVYSRSKEVYLQAMFARTLRDWLLNIHDLYKYIFTEPFAGAAILASLIGFYSLWSKGRRNIIAITAITFLINVILTSLGLFPFGGGRQSIYLLPLLALAVGAFVQHSLEILKTVLQKNQNLSKWASRGKSAAAAISALLFIVSTVLLALNYKQTDFLRRYGGPSWREFPVTRKAYMQLHGSLRKELHAGDVILTNGQTSKYILWAFNRRQSFEPFSDDLLATRYLGVDCYFIPTWHIATRERLVKILKEIDMREPDGGERARIYVLNMGWNDPVREALLELSSQTSLMEKQLIIAGSSIFAVDSEMPIQMLEQSPPRAGGKGV
jgi:hypothetical protein